MFDKVNMGGKVRKTFIMQNIKKVLMQKGEDGTISFTPVEEITDCKIITINDKTIIVIHEETIPGGASDFLGDHNVVRELSEDDTASILNGSIECYVEVEGNGSLSMPSNVLGHKMLVLHLKPPKKDIAQIMRNRGRSLIGTGNYCPDCGGLCGNSNHDRKKW